MRLQLLSLCVPGNTQHKYFFCWIEIQCSGDCCCKLALHDDLSRPCLAVHGQDRTLQFATFSPETLFCLAGILCPPILGRWIFFFYEDSSLEILGQKILGSRRWRWTIGSLRFRWFCWSQKTWLPSQPPSFCPQINAMWRCVVLLGVSTAPRSSAAAATNTPSSSGGAPPSRRWRCRRNKGILARRGLALLVGSPVHHTQIIAERISTPLKFVRSSGVCSYRGCVLGSSCCPPCVRWQLCFPLKWIGRGESSQLAWRSSYMDWVVFGSDLDAFLFVVSRHQIKGTLH